MIQTQTHLSKFLYRFKAGGLCRIHSLLMRSVVAGTIMLINGINCANAVELLCSSSENLSALNKDEFSVALVKDGHVALEDLPQLFSASYKNDSNEAIRVCVFPPESPSTQSLLSSLGVSRASFKALLAHHDVSEDQREIKLVSSESEMFQCVEEVYPAVGYAPHSMNSGRDLGCY